MIDAAQLVRAGMEKDISIKHPDRVGSKRTYCYASGYHPCSRHLFHQMQNPEAKEKFSIDAKAHMDRGVDTEARLKVWVDNSGRFSDPPYHAAGEQERLELKDREGNVVLVGRKDFDLVVGQRGEHGVFPTEVKDWRTMHQSIETVEDLLRSPWTRKGLYQLLAYLYGSEMPMGYLILNTPTFPKFIPVVLEDHLQEMEDFLNAATPACAAAREAEAGGTPDYPPMIDDPSECRKCEFFGNVCLPPDIQIGEAAAVVTDPAIIQDVEREAELHEAHKEYGRLHKRNAERFRGAPPISIVGDKLIKTKHSERKSYKVPKEVKEQYLEMGSSFSFTIADLNKQ